MARPAWLHILVAAAVAVAVLLFVRMHNANGAPLASEHKMPKTTPCKVGLALAATGRGRNLT